ncbi:hypothetical protein CTA2_1945 [Colletotrichum tanaceti]|uniref:Oxidoreductase n=1 Tax=Colletotrichum tanaceti TaxID=1306861 RepID=A0A4U6X608_9PEZI|nr:hypothetical protein CTA2_1945 [Colletotrichum tanaceti]TKW50882.1 hypothetical protein CTA1_11506 [Colletotrichum tanaceti]
MPFPSKTTLITDATSGTGLARADRLVTNDTYVIAVGRRADRLDALVSAHGPEKVAAEPFDVTDLEALPPRRSVDFTSPSSISLSSVSSELATNYLVHMITHFLPHLQCLQSSTTTSTCSKILFSSGLALVTIPRCPNYCAKKSALHSLAWSLRAQLAAHGPSAHIRVVEVVPPAVWTELHSQQSNLGAAGQSDLGMPLHELIEETWVALVDRNEDEIVVGPTKTFAHVETSGEKNV